MTDYIDDDRDVITAGTIAGLAHCDKHDEHTRGCAECWGAHAAPKADFMESVEASIKATAKGDAEATIAAKGKHVEAAGFFRRSWEGVKTWGIEVKAKWGWK